MSASSWVHVDVEEIKAETDKAFLFVIDGEERWVPRSQVADPDDYKRGDKEASVSITEFIARKLGL